MSAPTRPTVEPTWLELQLAERLGLDPHTVPVGSLHLTLYGKAGEVTWSEVDPHHNIIPRRADLDLDEATKLVQESIKREPGKARIIVGSVNSPVIGELCTCAPVPPEPGVHFGGIDPKPDCPVHAYLF